MSSQIVQGADDVKRALRELPDKLRRRMLRNALAAGARIVRNAAKINAPVLQRNSDTKTRTIGLLSDSIKVRTSKRDRKDGNVGVFVNVKPAKPGDRGARSKKDPYYWQWLEFGRSAGVTKRRQPQLSGRTSLRRGPPKRVNTGAIPAMHFLRDASALLPGAGIAAIERQLKKEVSKLNSSLRPDW